MMEPDCVDYAAAACADALVEGLTISALQAAHDVSETPEQFFWAVQGAIKLKELVNDNARGH